MVDSRQNKNPTRFSRGSVKPETLEDPNHCPTTRNHKHRPDPATLHVNHDGDDAYVDVNCKACGRSGCVGKFDPEKVDW
jgi:hypothetical protein